MRNMLKSKRSLEMSFAVIFSIIAGSVILLLAIYTAARFIQTAKYAGYSESAKSLANILGPVVNSISTDYSPAPAKFSKQTRVYLDCFPTSRLSPTFGRQTLSFSEESGLLKKWSEPGANISRYNKYIFSDRMMEGKTLYIFAKPLHFGFKVDDLVYLSMDDYCFTGAVPEFVRENYESGIIRNSNVTGRIAECKKDSVKVCFGFESSAAGSACNMGVVFDDDSGKSGRVVKSETGKTLEYYGESLLYAAIFSSPEIYECNIKRLGMKAGELAKIYLEKIDITREKECSSAIGPELGEIAGISANLSSAKLSDVYIAALDMDRKNCDADCMIYAPGENAC